MEVKEKWLKAFNHRLMFHLKEQKNLIHYNLQSHNCSYIISM